MPQTQFEGKTPPPPETEMNVSAFPTMGGEAINIGEVNMGTNVPRPNFDTAVTEKIPPISATVAPPTAQDAETSARFDRIERALSAITDRIDKVEKKKTEKPYIVAGLRSVFGAIMIAFAIFVVANFMELSWKEVAGLMVTALVAYIVIRGGLEGFIDQKAADESVSTTTP
jgi:hypothetical protein